MLRHRVPLIACLLALLSMGATRHYRTESRHGATAIAFNNTYSTLCEGTNDKVDFGNNLAVDLSANEFTISLWFRAPSLAVRDIVAKANPFNGPLFNYAMGITADGRLFGYFGSSAKTTESASASTIAVDTWYHAAYTVRNISGTYTGNIWLDGVKQGSDVTAPGTDDASAVPFRLCASKVLDNPDTARPFIGNVDEVTTWGVGFTQAEVAEIRNGGKPANPDRHSRAASLTHWWRMGDDTFPTITDRKGTLNGTCTDMAGVGTNFVTAVP